jgi:hypothetical protein
MDSLKHKEGSFQCLHEQFEELAWPRALKFVTGLANQFWPFFKQIDKIAFTNSGTVKFVPLNESSNVLVSAIEHELPKPPRMVMFNFPYLPFH